MKDGEVLGFTPDSRQVFIRTQSTISLWTPDSGREAVVVTLGKGVSAGAAAVTLDGSRIIMAGSDGLLKEWDVRTGGQVRTYGKQPASCGMATSPDGRLVAVQSWATVSIWDCATGTKIVELKDGTDLDLHNPLFSPDGSQIFAHCQYEAVCAWDISAGRPLIDVAVDPAGVAFDGSGRQNRPRTRLAASARQGFVRTGSCPTTMALAWP